MCGVVWGRFVAISALQRYWGSCIEGGVRNTRVSHSSLKARFRCRTFHEPNLIRIKTDANYLDRLN